MADDLTLLRFFGEHKGEEFGGSDLMVRTGISSGRLYVLLTPLEEQGLITARWEDLPAGETRPRRRFYRITKQGEVALYFRSGDGKAVTHG